MQQIHLMGADGALGSQCSGCRHSASVLLETLHLDRKQLGYNTICHPVIQPDLNTTPAKALDELCSRIASDLRKTVKKGKPFVFFSSDHSQAMGVWRGAAQALLGKRLGLLWIDAHLDAHTPLTSPSGNSHGMPVAGLLGADDPFLWHICGQYGPFDPQQICLVGAHSYEPEELIFLRALGVKIFDMPSIHHCHINRTLRQAWQYLAKHNDVIGISLDLDAIDPKDAPAVAVPVHHGLNGKALLGALTALPPPVGLEISEYNPYADSGGTTRALIEAIIRNTFHRKNMPYKSLGFDGRVSRSTSSPRAYSAARSYTSVSALKS